MGFGTSLLLLAIGAVLAFAVDASWELVDLDTVGWILMVAGAAVLLWTVIELGVRRGDRSAPVVEG